VDSLVADENAGLRPAIPQAAAFVALCRRNCRLRMRDSLNALLRRDNFRLF